MTEGLFYEDADDPGAPGFGATDAAEEGQQTGLSMIAALNRLKVLGVKDLAAIRAAETASHTTDGIVYLDRIRVRYEAGYGYSVERAPGGPPGVPSGFAACGAPSGSADVTGIRCELPSGHKGLHEAMVPYSWGDLS